MKSIPVSKFWGHDLKDYIGTLSLSEEAYKMINDNPQAYEFAVGFIGKPQEDGTYKEAKLIEVSLITKVKKDNG